MILSRDITYNLHKLVFLLDKITDQELLTHVQLTFSQLKILMAIRTTDQISQKDIASYWDMTEAAVSRQVESLIKNNFVFKEENTENRREHLLTLTVKGKKITQKALQIVDAKHEELFAVIDQKERKVMVEGLHKLLKVTCNREGSADCTPCT